MRIKNTKTVTYRGTDRHGIEIPCILIEGKFLNGLGFKRGDRVKVEYKQGKITVNKMRQKNIKPECRLTGIDGNVFTVIACVSKALKENGQYHKANEFRKRAISSSSYNEVLNLCNRYVNVY